MLQPRLGIVEKAFLEAAFLGVGFLKQPSPRQIVSKQCPRCALIPSRGTRIFLMEPSCDTVYLRGSHHQRQLFNVMFIYVDDHGAWLWQQSSSTEALAMELYPIVV